MDITIDVEKYRLNVRAAAIIIHDNKVLFHKSVNEDYYALVGGRVMLGEDSASTVKRELFEELGKKIETTGYVTTVENFFKAKEKEYHEIMFVHLAEFIDEQDKKITEPMKNVEGEKEAHIHYEWLDLDKIDEYQIKPVAIKKVLKEGKFPVHTINDNRK